MFNYVDVVKHLRFYYISTTFQLHSLFKFESKVYVFHNFPTPWSDYLIIQFNFAKKRLEIAMYVS